MVKLIKQLFCKHKWKHRRAYILEFRNCEKCGCEQFRDKDTNQRFRRI